MEFEPSQSSDLLGPLLVERALSDVPIFGQDKADIKTIIENTLKSHPPVASIVKDIVTDTFQLPETFQQASSTSAKLRAIRACVDAAAPETSQETKTTTSVTDGNTQSLAERELSREGPPSCSELHEKLLSSFAAKEGLPKDAQSIIDHAMLLRAKEKYLFDAPTNRVVVSDDPWLAYVWDWIADAEAATEDGAMTMQPLDLSYMGVHSVWTNDLGKCYIARRNPPQLAANYICF
jgi:WD repeat-containing protein mio